MFLLATDVSQFRLDLALKMGATHTVLVDRADSGQDIARKVCDVMGASAQYTIECSGMESSLQAAIYVRAVRENPSVKCKFDEDINSFERSASAHAPSAAVKPCACYCQATRPGGVVAPVALDPPEVNLPVVHAAVREIDIRGVFSYCNEYVIAIAFSAGARLVMQSYVYYTPCTSA